MYFLSLYISPIAECNVRRIIWTLCQVEYVELKRNSDEWICVIILDASDVIFLKLLKQNAWSDLDDDSQAVLLI